MGPLGGWPVARVWRCFWPCCLVAVLGIARGLPPPLDLEAFEDTDCLSNPGSELLLALLTELCEVVEAVVNNLSSEPAWANFRAWSTERATLLVQLSGNIFAKPFCEPGKVASAAATCVLLLGEPSDDSRHKQARSCAEDVDNLLQATASGDKNMFDTRLHMFLRSPWPAFRLLDLFVRLYPNDERVAEAELGRCRPHEDWEGNEIEFDWAWFKEALTSSLLVASSDQQLFALDPKDGPLSEQYRARWMRLYQAPSFREAAAFGSAAFYQFRRNQWEAGCHPGIVASYLMQVVTFCIRDTEAWLQRYVGAAWRLLNLLTPVTSLIHTDWAVFRALHVGNLLRRHPSAWSLGSFMQDQEAPQWPQRDGGGGSVPPPGAAPAQGLQQRLREALLGAGAPQRRQRRTRDGEAAAAEPPETVYVTAVWGSLGKFVHAFLSRWSALSLPLLLFLALDEKAAFACAERQGASPVACIEMPQRFGVEGFVAKYIAMSVAAQCSHFAIWLDFDVYFPADPTERLRAPLEGDDAPPLALSSTLTSRSLSPSIIVARGPEASSLLLRYAAWLYEHPYILDHQGWDAFLQNRDGDFSGNWDYKGRNISSAPVDGLQLSFAPLEAGGGPEGDGAAGAKAPPRFAVLSPDSASGDGLLVPPDRLTSFHFWGAVERQEELFNIFYPFEGRGFSPGARAVLAQYLREPVSGSAASVAARAQDDALHLTAITYADGCCEKSIERNRRTALEVGVDEARVFGRGDLEPRWAARHAEVLSQRKGGGWWLWKPHMILRTLQDSAVPWHTGVVLWLDAGNYYVGDPRPVVAQALRNSDVAAMRLKCCTESDWTSAKALRRLGGDGYAIADLPQLGAYFVILRKTTTALAFVEDWLRFAEDPEILVEPAGTANMFQAPGYQRHMADQSIFSVLFKQRGFAAMSLEEGHRVVQLDRWRE